MYPSTIHRLCWDQIGAVYFTYCKISMSSQDRDYFQCNISSFLSVSVGKVLLLSSGGKAIGPLALGKPGQLCIRRAVYVYTVQWDGGCRSPVTRLLSTCDADGGVITCLKPINIALALKQRTEGQM